MECKFVAGQKVVCIAEQCTWEILQTNGLPERLPEKDKIYEIAVVTTSALIPVAIVSLKEIGLDYYYTFYSFRPLSDRPKEADTDISVFKPLLAWTGPWGVPAPEITPVKVPELEPVA